MIQNPSHQIVNISGVVVMFCQIKSFPNPTITWFKDNQIVSNSKYSMESLGILSFSNLTLINVTIMDSGNYQCRGNNTAGNVSSSEAILIVHCKFS